MSLRDPSAYEQVQGHGHALLLSVWSYLMQGLVIWQA